MVGKFRIPGVTPRAAQMISSRDRESAIHELTGFHERGFIDDIELEHRVEYVKLAVSAHDIEPWFADLRGGRRGRGDVRASEDDRAAALRRLALHHEAGQLNDAEHARRVALVGGASTPHEIVEALTELPPLKPRRQSRGERFASDAEREAAAGRLNRELADGRLTIEEHRSRIDVVYSARTRNEIQAAFPGLDPHNLEKPVETVARVGAGVARGGKRILGGVILFGWAAFSVLVVLLWQITGIGPTIPLIIVGAATLLLILLFSAPRLLISRRSQR